MTVQIYGHVEIVRQLLVKRADVNIKSREGYTPLHCAALNGQTQIVDMLLKAGANLDIADLHGYPDTSRLYWRFYDNSVADDLRSSATELS
jgi:ankyrin repeat protein